MSKSLIIGVLLALAGLTGAFMLFDWWQGALLSKIDQSVAANVEHLTHDIKRVSRQVETSSQGQDTWKSELFTKLDTSKNDLLTKLETSKNGMQTKLDTSKNVQSCASTLPALSPRFRNIPRAIVNMPDKVEVSVYEHPYKDWWKGTTNGFWEATTFEVIKTHVAPGKAYIDFGAWIGPTVLYAAAFTNRVYALEPDREALDTLVANIESNPFLKQHIVSVTNRCIANKRSKLKLSIYGAPGDSATQVVPEGEQASPKKLLSYEVDCLTLMEYCAEMEINPRDISLIKIDTEGGERFIMPSIAEWIRDMPSPKPSIWLSLHADFFPVKEKAFQDITAAIKTMGFKYVLNYEMKHVNMSGPVIPPGPYGMYLLTDEEKWKTI